MGEVPHQAFLKGFRFVVGMDNFILTLNAVVPESGEGGRVVNSLLSSRHLKLKPMLQPGLEVELRQPTPSANLTACLKNNSDECQLTLAVWKDATVQIKLTLD